MRTQGEWSNFECWGKHWVSVFEENGEKHVAEIINQGEWSENFSNACLISRAPNMLEMLKKIANILRPDVFAYTDFEKLRQDIVYEIGQAEK